MGVFHEFSNVITSSIKKIDDKIKMIPKIIQNIPDALKGPRKNYPPFFRDFKKKYGNIPIVNILVCKTPISETINTVLNLISSGQFEENKRKFKYDNMFHIFLILELSSVNDDKRYVRLEKNQVLNIGFIKKDDKKLKNNICEQVYIYDDDPLTINILLDRTLKNQGESMFLYNGINNNCQIFINNVLASSNLITPELEEFILQDTSKIIGELPKLSKQIIKGTTDLAGIFDILMYGAKINYFQF